MAIKPPIGIDDFSEVRRGGYLYVDKTALIEEVVENPAKVQLMIRPRRFGKTINMSTLRYFFDTTVEDGASLFSGLIVEECPCFSLLGRFPVVFLSLKDLKARNYDMFLELMAVMMGQIFQERSYLLEGMNEGLKKRFGRLVDLEASEVALMDSLAFLTGLLAEHHQEKVILLIDEYDSPIHEGYAKGFYQEVVDFMRTFLGKALKGNAFLEKAVLTGILRVARESIFSDLNNIRVFSLLEFEFADKFGFTELETARLLEQAGLKDRSVAVRRWYNGYVFGDTVIYNPWSIINFIAAPKQGLRPYWVNTSANTLIRKQLLHAGPEVQDHLLRLIQGDQVETLIQEQTVFQDLPRDSQTLWSFLLFCGYLKVMGRTIKQQRFHYRLAIPNTEVLLFFEDTIQGWLRRNYGEDKVSLLLVSLERGDFEAFERLLTQLNQAVLSYYDTARKSERVYHAFVLGLLVHFRERYEINSNRESGLGRYDVLMRPKDVSDRGFVMELKAVDSHDQLEDALEAGLAQIEKRRYGVALEEAGVLQRYEVAIAFCGKHVRVRGREVTGSVGDHPSSGQ